MSKKMSEIFTINEYQKGDYKFLEEGFLKDSKKEGLWKTFVLVEEVVVQGGVLKPGQEPKRTKTGKTLKSLYKDETYFNGELDGPYKTFNWSVEGNHIIDEGLYKKGKKTGEWITHGRFNYREIYNYKDGKKHGSYKRYQQGWLNSKEHSTNILIEEGTFKDDKLHGNQKSYRFKNHYGTFLTSDLNYKNGKLHGYCKTYQSTFQNIENLKEEGVYEDGTKKGKWIYYKDYGNNQINCICEYDYNEGGSDFKITNFKNDGNLHSIEHYKGKLPHGSHLFYDSEGKKSETIYKDGLPIEKKY